METKLLDEGRWVVGPGLVLWLRADGTCKKTGYTLAARLLLPLLTITPGRCDKGAVAGRQAGGCLTDRCPAPRQPPDLPGSSHWAPLGAAKEQQGMLQRQSRWQWLLGE